MSLSGTTLKNGLKAAILAELQSLFPVPMDLLPAEQALYNASQDKIAQAYAFGDGPTTVSHITGNAQVNSGITVQVNTISGTGATTGTGTVS